MNTDVFKQFSDIQPALKANYSESMSLEACETFVTQKRMAIARLASATTIPNPVALAMCCMCTQEVMEPMKRILKAEMGLQS